QQRAGCDKASAGSRVTRLRLYYQEVVIMKHNFWVLAFAALGLFVLSCSPAASPVATPFGAPARQEVMSSPPQSPSLSTGQAKAGAPAPAAAPDVAAPSPASPGGAATSDRMIINNAQISMEVKDTTDSLNAIGRIAEDQGGFVVSNNFRYEGERKVATVTIRVPGLAYQATLAELRRLAVKVQGEDSKAQDVTEEYSDLQAQLSNLQATEAQYLDLLKKAQSIDDILRVQARISDTRSQLDRIKGRMVYMERTTDMASITISLFSLDRSAAGTSGDPGGWWKTPAEAFQQSLVFLTRIATAFVIAISFFWWLIILMGAGYLAWRIRRSTKTPQPLSVTGDGR
ncbi:MAG: DUF4349 domain-containing protein, partial [Dehalococcoidia bacterium]|nr:DUF4349 domain-containing protein [Dehalococcoidia bacterium]